MENTITILYGHNELVIKPPVITKVITKRRWWFDKVEYWIELEFVKIGPYGTENEALEHMRYFK